MLCKNVNKKIVNLSDGAYSTCAGGVCGGWKFVYNGCSIDDSECAGRSGAWLPVASVCNQGFYTPAVVVAMAPDGSSSSSSSSSSGLPQTSSSSSSVQSGFESSSSSSYVGMFLLTETGEFITTENGQRIILDESSSESSMGVMAREIEPSHKPAAKTGLFRGIAKSISDLLG